jgi:GntR family transcriptional repressor for pyruvate dehydrogenase complex
VRLALEAETASHAALNATEEQLQELDDIIDKMAEIRGDQQQVVETDVALHLTIAKVSANALIFDLLSLIRGQLQHALEQLGRLPGNDRDGVAEHRRIVEAIRRRDPESARRLMREHIEEGLKRYLQVHSSDDASGEGKDCEESPATANAG